MPRFNLSVMIRQIATLLAIYFLLLGLSYMGILEELNIFQIGYLQAETRIHYVRAALSFLTAIALFIFAIDPSVLQDLLNNLRSDKPP